jgi:hypothetical protein
MERRQGWLFPMMVVAAASMIAFGCIGIAGITGHLPLSPPADAPIAGPTTQPSTLVTADAQTHGATVESTLKDSAAPAPQDPGRALGKPGQPVVPN